MRSLDAEGLSPRNVNKRRQVLGSMFQYACLDDSYELPSNPVTGSDKRREPLPAALDYYEADEVEALRGRDARRRARQSPAGGARHPHRCPGR